MAYIKGPHPKELGEVDKFLTDRGFELFSDQSGTVDYLHPESALILRDCHLANWVRFKGILVPIDIIPEWKR